MKRLTLLICLVLCLGLISVTALTVDVDSASNDEIVLSFSGLNTLDIIFDEVSATAETDTVSDTYFVDYELSVEGEEILLTADVSPIFEDYETSELNHIVISGTSDGEDFAKRVAVRSNSDVRINFQAPIQSKSITTIYWVIALALFIVFIALLYAVLKTPAKKIKPIKRKKAKKRKKKVVKKKAKKKSSKKKVKKKKRKKR